MVHKVYHDALYSFFIFHNALYVVVSSQSKFNGRQEFCETQREMVKPKSKEYWIEEEMGGELGSLGEDAKSSSSRAHKAKPCQLEVQNHC